MKWLMLLVAVVFAACLSVFTQAEEQKFYEISLHYDNGILGFDNDISVKPGIAGRVAGLGDYRADVVSFRNETLYSENFGISTLLIADVFDSGRIESRSIEIGESIVILQLPYFKDGKSVAIFSPAGRNILEIPVMQFAKVCGDSVCGANETALNCPQDCKQQDIRKSSGSYAKPAAFMAIIVGLLAVLAIILSRKQGDKNRP